MLRRHYEILVQGVVEELDIFLLYYTHLLHALWMSNEIFQKLYESSKLLVSSNNQDQVPVLQRGLDQIDTETRRLFGKHKTDQEQKANA